MPYLLLNRLLNTLFPEEAVCICLQLMRVKHLTRINHKLFIEKLIQRKMLPC